MHTVRGTRALLSLLALLPTASCVAFGGPAPTASSSNPDKALKGWTPKPTNGPSIAELRRRQSDNAETCGYVDGDISNYVECNIGRTCMLYTSGFFGMAGCCSGSNYEDCGWVSSCVNYEEYWTSDYCDSDCDDNTFIRKCTDVSSPYCVTWTYPGDDVVDFACTDESSSSFRTILFTGSDSDSSSTASLSLTTLTDGDITTSTSTSTSDLFGFTSSLFDDFSTLSFPSFSLDTEYSFPTEYSGGGGGGYGGRKKKSKTGTIVGGAVGGIAALAVIGGGIIAFLIKRKRDQKAAAAGGGAADAPALASPPMQQQPPPGPPGTMQPPPPGFYQPDAQSPHTSTYGPPMPIEQKLGHPSPGSQPTTPAPVYQQPYYANNGQAPPMPAQSPSPYYPPPGASPPVPPQSPPPQQYQPQPVQSVQSPPPAQTYAQPHYGQPDHDLPELAPK